MIRTFIALELPETLHKTLQTKLEAWQKLSAHGINWVAAQNLHITLLFIGDMPEEQLPDAKEALRELCRKQAPFELSAKGFELFPAVQPRLIWARLESGNDEINKFHRKLLYELRQIGLEPDAKPLKLHVTMGRIKAPQSPDFERTVLATELEQSPMRFDTITFYKSILRPEGPSYSILEQIKL